MRMTRHNIDSKRAKLENFLQGSSSIFYPKKYFEHRRDDFNYLISVLEEMK
jgi:hypothetical protein